MTYQCIRQPPCPASGKSYFIIIVVKAICPVGMTYFQLLYSTDFTRVVMSSDIWIDSKRRANLRDNKFHAILSQNSRSPRFHSYRIAILSHCVSRQYRNRYPLILNSLSFSRRECGGFTFALALVYCNFLLLSVFFFGLSQSSLSLEILCIVTSIGCYIRTDISLVDNNDDPIDHWSSIVFFFFFSITIVFVMFITLWVFNAFRFHLRMLYSCSSSRVCRHAATMRHFRRNTHSHKSPHKLINFHLRSMHDRTPVIISRHCSGAQDRGKKIND